MECTDPACRYASHQPHGHVDLDFPEAPGVDEVTRQMAVHARHQYATRWVEIETDIRRAPENCPLTLATARNLLFTAGVAESSACA